ncbi:hypothetical protein P4H35_31490 [Paenibacillus taichungensis]|uniref:hypothetical protein n=1 Tax=Paenibacillus taichungensis TaxID=484184 RepID=UPI002DB5C2B3|nr:hypothetical protein [Paenibacillus taichungensis]MEC0200877.1 hypothetical protein [Paenibacillus taichungensis]
MPESWVKRLSKRLLKQVKQIVIERLESHIKWEENPIFKELYLNYWIKLTSDALPSKRQ